MAHIHKLIDFAVAIFIVYKNRVLLIRHKELKKWLPVGGHIELDEDPEEAIFREVKEETGLEEIEIFGQKPSIKSGGTKFLYPPTFLDIHDISQKHKHIGMIYFARAKSDKIVLAQKEHKAIRWFTRREIESPSFNLRPSIKFYAKEVLKKDRLNANEKL